MKEVDLAIKVIEWLSSQHWDIYQEVHDGNSTADIVAVQGQLIWIIECKLSLSLELLGQALDWRAYAHFVSIAIPKQKQRSSTKGRWAAKRFLKHYGIGVIEVKRERETTFRDIDRQEVPPSLNRKAWVERIKNSLNEKQKYFLPAGSSGGGYFTPFKETCRGIVRLVNRYPGIHLKELIDKLKDHHYASEQSARASISHWTREGKIKGIYCEQDGKFLRFFPGKKEN